MTTTAVTSTEPRRAADVVRFIPPVPLARLVRAHLRIWRSHRALVIASAVATVAGLAAVLIRVAAHTGPVAADTVQTQFISSLSACSFIWLAVGAVAGAAPFRMKWAELVLTFAPRRGRCFAAALLSLMLGGAAVVAALTVVCAAGTAVVLAASGRAPGSAVAVFAGLPAAVVVTLVNVAVGFLLGAAARGVAVPLILGYVIAPALPLLSVHSVALGVYLDLTATAQHLAAATVGVRDITGLALWVVLPAVVAVWRLRHSPTA
jgi:hypothetical protein